eukprot:PLAT9350.1.p1 GENE.PLAT9350.1~~PLAT9350.1.p1  ORF type:complete len:293 (+),score=76.84 PLAT9350.1:65-943(+)
MLRWGGQALLRRRLSRGRERRKLVQLEEGAVWKGAGVDVPHEALLAAGYGGSVAQLPQWRVHRPALGDYTTLMRRGATPTYPKDAVAIVERLALVSGQSVLEAGSGSGALTLFLSAAVGETGRVYSVEERVDHGRRAQKNVAAWQQHVALLAGASAEEAAAAATVGADGACGNVRFLSGSLESVCTQEERLTRLKSEGPRLSAAVLDMMEPWQQLPSLLPLLQDDAAVVALLPNITQVLALRSSISQLPLQVWATEEVTHRAWELHPPAAHPAFAQLGHTAFIVSMRKWAVE